MAERLPPCATSLVSILAHLERWALPAKASRRASRRGVSILAHLERWALHPIFTTRATAFALFQSSPTSKGGRYRPNIAASGMGSRFQSSPTSKGGRYRKKLLMLNLITCFNPRPPRKVGATLFPRLVQPGIDAFQSSPTSKGGRYFAWCGPPGSSLAVSILAHLERWALQHSFSWLSIFCKFQSSPTSKGGRYGIGEIRRRADAAFQSSPTSKGGRYDNHKNNGCNANDVSILAHLERWALHHQAGCGDCLDCVSILAHLERWALRPTCNRSPSTGARFNPRPPRKVGATTWINLSTRTEIGFNPRPPRKVGATRASASHDGRKEEFQSSPTSKGGRYYSPIAGSRARTVFQSSPTSKGGRYPRIHGAGLAELLVSILAHLERWALPLASYEEVTTEMFQSSPTSKGGRYDQCRARERHAQTFQSSPTSKGGRYPSADRPRRRLVQFQSSPTSKGGRYAHPAIICVSGCHVSILAHLERWALHRARALPLGALRVSILAHLERWALRGTASAARRANCSFQSSPTSKGGRYML